NRLCSELHTVSWSVYCDRIPHTFRARPNRILGSLLCRVRMFELHPVRHRELSRAEDCRRRFVDVSVHRPVRGVFLELPLGHCRRLYRTADHDRNFDDLRAAQVDGMDCVASLGWREKVGLMTSGRARLAGVELVFAPVATDSV